jgi:2-amino-4-hydroxy-6-hydroxymethyldihydropteridine diphosphokinase
MMNVNRQMAKKEARNILRKLRIYDRKSESDKCAGKIRIFAAVTEKRSINKAYLLTGGNMGSREAQLDRAKMLIHQQAGRVVQASLLYETSAWGNIPQPSFLNQVLCIETTLDATALLYKVLDIEQQMGRERSIKYGPRIIDIDVLLYDELILETPDLTVPHPFLHVRRFTLVPLAEIAPHFMHPVLNKSVHQLLLECPDSLDVKKFSPENE